ncbi:UVR8 [Symbiodinium sp. CCMP2456]|nr:UVR8 [Symbiodinium sp. CCMP2456]
MTKHCKPEPYLFVPRAMCASRVALGLPILSWISWMGACWFTSFCFGSRYLVDPSKSRGHVRLVSYRKRMIVDGYKTEASLSNKCMVAMRSDRLVGSGLGANGQRELGAFAAVSAGNVHTCEVKSDGQLLCFGCSIRDDSGQCDVPTDLGRVVAVSAGYDHTCAVKSDGQLVCFGETLVAE